MKIDDGYCPYIAGFFNSLDVFIYINAYLIGESFVGLYIFTAGSGLAHDEAESAESLACPDSSSSESEAPY